MAKRMCSVEGCDRPHDTKGFCGMHYRRWLRNDDPIQTRRRTRGMCTIEGCTRKRHARGWCTTHYMRWRVNGDPLVTQHAPDSAPLAWLQAVAAEGEGEGCRDWPFASHTRGYGNIWYEGRARHATHVVLALVGRSQPPGLQVLHSCDNPPCCAPWHLSWGTNRENIDDMLSKGRSRWQRPHTYQRNAAPRRTDSLCWCGRFEDDEFHRLNEPSPE